MTTEIVLVLPLLFTLVLVIGQVTVWAHATHMAQATASHALSATRVEDGTAQSGRSDAQQVLDQLGHGPLRGAHISVTRDVESASVRVEGTATSVVPFLHLPVHAEAAGPVEKFHLADQAAP
ncbi:TadE/TadG family type IV pilus assembly protein [Streptomyces violaceusniger]|uniref:TadE/TadG family type IV pilus assembly protein n=1 Tax=Streptomyces violaceusniger TaxID=68280 RepID=UPI0031D0C230